MSKTPSAFNALAYSSLRRMRREKLPFGVYKGLVANLFGTMKSFSTGVVGSLAGVAAAYYIHPRFEYLVCGMGVAAVNAVRCALLLSYLSSIRRQKRSRRVVSPREVAVWEALYAFGSQAFMLSVGLLMAVSIHFDDVNQVGCTILVIGCAGAMAGRNAARPHIVHSQVLCALGPMFLAFVAGGGSGYLFAGLVCICGLSVYAFTKELYVQHCGALVDHFTANRLVGVVQASRVLSDSALNNMSQGLCTFDTEGRVMVTNRKFMALFGSLPDDGHRMAAHRLFAHVAAHVGLGGEQARTFVDAAVAMLRTKDMLPMTDGRRHFQFEFNLTSDGQGTVVTAQDVTEARIAQDRIERMAHYDMLTGLPNRHTFQETLEATLAATDGSICLLSIDLDKFKEVNDSLGHPMGDKLLKHVAERLRTSLRPGDVVSRFGGDEFAVLINPETRLDIGEVAMRIIKELSCPYMIDGHKMEIGASVGTVLSGTVGDAGREAEEMLRRSDLAMYAAKKAGRRMHKGWTVEMDRSERERFEMKRDLEMAIERGELHLEYQPIVDARSGSVVSCEALVRWMHSTKGYISPGVFIPIAEECGLIIQIGEWVLRKACMDAAGWPGHVGVAVNLSPTQIKLTDVTESIRQALRISMLQPRRLEVEITENVSLGEDKRTLAMIEAIKGLGVKLALDDFGKEYSTLAQIDSLPIDKIKVDKMFVDKVCARSGGRATIRAIVNMASEMDKVVVCEGVESLEQVDQLLQLGASLMQGWYFSKSVPLADLPPLLAERHYALRPNLRVVA